MILHLIRNDDKFVSYIIRQHEELAPGKCFYGIIPFCGDQNRNYPELLKLPHSFITNLTDFKKIFYSRNDWGCIYINCLSPDIIDAISLIPKHIPIVWQIWGYEIYSVYPKYVSNILLPKTRKWQNRNISLVNSIRTWLGLRRQYFCGKYPSSFRKINYFAGPFEDEYKLLKNEKILNDDCKYIQMSVGWIEDILPTNDEIMNPKSTEKNNILLGNSATSTNNHIEAMDLLSKLDLTARKVFVPLSYGNPEYREKILSYGQSVLGEHFIPLLNFMPFDEYRKILGSCGIVIMNHLRQQAMGNIFLMLGLGAKIYLNDTSVYRQLRQWEIDVRPIRELDPDNSEALSLFDENRIEDNRTNLMRNINKEKLKKSFIAFLDNIKSR